MSKFAHQRHKPPSPLDHHRELVLACPPMQSHVNLARIIRAAGCCGVERMVVCGRVRVDRKIARDAADAVTLEVHRSLPPVLQRYRTVGYRIVGLEQTTGSVCLYDYRFPRRTLLVIGHERQGLNEQILELLDDVVEIPVYGKPYSHNVATAAAMALYEYCRQWPGG